MDTKTLRGKTPQMIATELKEAQGHLKTLGFKIAANQLKNVREVRKIKRAIARMQTLLNEKR